MRNNVTQRVVFERYLTEAEEKKLFKHVGRFKDLLAQRDAAWMMLLRQTGIRVGTLALLTVADAREMVALKRVIVPDEYAKGGHGYETPLNEDGRSALKKLLQIRKEQGHASTSSAPLLMSRKKTGLSVRSLQARMAYWRVEAGLKLPASPHYFRHTLAKRILATSEGLDPLGRVQIVLGHGSRASTAIYALPDWDEVARDLENAS